MDGEMDGDGERRGFCARTRNGFSKMHGGRHGAMSRLASYQAFTPLHGLHLLT